MAEIEDIRNGLAANLKAIENAQVSAWFITDPTPPSLYVVGTEDVEYGGAFGESEDTWLMIIRGLVQGTNAEGTQKRLDRWRSSTGLESVKRVIETDKTLGGIADDLRVTRSTRPIVFTFGGNEFLGSEWTVQVETSNT